MSWEVFFGYLTGLRFVADIELATLLRTAVVLNTCNAVACRLIAHNNGLDKNRWTALGFVFGFWAVACVLLLGSARSLGDDKGRR